MENIKFDERTREINWSREPRVFVVQGPKGIGKTYFIQKKIEDSINSSKGLIPKPCLKSSQARKINIIDYMDNNDNLEIDKLKATLDASYYSMTRSTLLAMKNNVSSSRNWIHTMFLSLSLPITSTVDILGAVTAANKCKKYIHIEEVSQLKIEEKIKFYRLLSKYADEPTRNVYIYVEDDVDRSKAEGESEEAQQCRIIDDLFSKAIIKEVSVQCSKKSILEILEERGINFEEMFSGGNVGEILLSRKELDLTPRNIMSVITNWEIMLNEIGTVNADISRILSGKIFLLAFFKVFIYDPETFIDEKLDLTEPGTIRLMNFFYKELFKEEDRNLFIPEGLSEHDVMLMIPDMDKVLGSPFIDNINFRTFLEEINQSQDVTEMIMEWNFYLKDELLKPEVWEEWVFRNRLSSKKISLAIDVILQREKNIIKVFKLLNIAKKKYYQFTVNVEKNIKDFKEVKVMLDIVFEKIYFIESRLFSKLIWIFDGEASPKLLRYLIDNGNAKLKKYLNDVQKFMVDNVESEDDFDLFISFKYGTDATKVTNPIDFLYYGIGFVEEDEDLDIEQFETSEEDELYISSFKIDVKKYISSGIGIREQVKKVGKVKIVDSMPYTINEENPLEHIYYIEDVVEALDYSWVDCEVMFKLLSRYKNQLCTKPGFASFKLRKTGKKVVNIRNLQLEDLKKWGV